MGNKGRRKKNRQHQCPPLTLFDKSIYGGIIVFSFLGALALIWFFSDIQSLIAFSKPGTVANLASAGFLFTLPFLLTFEIGVFIISISGWESERPIFGSKKYRYGEFPYKKDCVPFFSRKKYHVWKTPAQKKYVRNLLLIWCAMLLAFACLVPLGLFGRTALYQDNHIENINLVNMVSDSYTVEDYAHLTIHAHYVHKFKGPDYWDYDITIQMKDGKDFIFSNEAFHSDDICLDKMIEIKTLFDAASITVKGEENLDRVVADKGYNDRQCAKLEALFSSSIDPTHAE